MSINVVNPVEQAKYVSLGAKAYLEELMTIVSLQMSIKGRGRSILGPRRQVPIFDKSETVNSTKDQDRRLILFVNEMLALIAMSS